MVQVKQSLAIFHIFSYSFIFYNQLPGMFRASFLAPRYGHNLGEAGPPVTMSNGLLLDMATGEPTPP